MPWSNEGRLALPRPEEEFRRFFQENRTQLVALAYLWCGDREDAVDLAQETLVRAWERWATVSSHPNPDAWARRVLHNLCTSRWRRLKIERSRTARSSPVQPVLPDAMEVDIARLVSRLAPKPRRALVLHDVVGLSVSEIASETGTSEGTVRSWLSRSRAILRSQLLANDEGVREGG
jgi:RNA polymerase sigma-70 factor (ECF subfamily)